MNENSRWRSVFHHNVTLPLIAIIAYLFLIAIANLIATYHSISTEQDLITAGGSIISVVLYALPAYGLMKLKRWARLMELSISLLSVGLGIVLMLAGMLGSGVLIIIPHGLIAIYLLSDKCRRAFGLIA